MDPASASPLLLSRRAFLKSAGIALGALALPGAFVSAASAAHGGLPALRLGLLLPAAPAAAWVAADLLAGFNRGLESLRREGLAVEVRAVELPLGYVGARAAALELLQSGVHVVAAGLNRAVAGQLAGLFREHRRPLLALNAGEYAARREAGDPFVFHHTLGLWQAHYALGAWAAANLGRKAGLVASLYDSGFDSLYAFRLGFESAGGQVVASELTHLVAGRSAIETAFDALQDARPDLLFAHYSGSAAAEFARACRSRGLAGVLPLAVSALAEAPAGAFRAAAWDAGQAPFALLGYEAALLLGAAWSSSDGRPAVLAEALSSVACDGPRGRLRLSAAGYPAALPLVLSGGPARAELPAPVDLLKTGPRTGWLNAYPCV